MSLSINQLVETLDKLYPFRTAMEWDNIGVSVGETNIKVKNILVSLDLTNEVIDEAIEQNVNLIITHHPLIFKPLKNITNETALGNRIIKLIKNEICSCAIHTNLDVSDNGTNDILFETLELCNKQPLFKSCENEPTLGRVGSLKKEISFLQFVSHVKEKLDLPHLTFVGNDDLVTRIALCTGSSSNPKCFLSAKEAGCDVYISGDLTYHNAQYAEDIGLKLIDATHFGTEVIALKSVVNALKNELALKHGTIGVIESRSNMNILKYL